MRKNRRSIFNSGEKYPSFNYRITRMIKRYIWSVLSPWMQGFLTNYAIKGRVQCYSLICKLIPSKAKIGHSIILPVINMILKCINKRNFCREFHHWIIPQSMATKISQNSHSKKSTCHTFENRIHFWHNTHFLASLRTRYFSGIDFAWCWYSSLEKSDISMAVVEASSEKLFSSSLER